jgi:hypothetical protein
MPSVDDAKIASLKAAVCDTGLSIAKRHRALFTLRNLPDDERAVRALGEAAVALCLLLHASGVPFSRDGVASAADAKRRSEILASAERQAVDSGQTVQALAAPGAGAITPAFRPHSLFVHDPTAPALLLR